MANNGLEGNNPSDKGVGGVTHKTEEYGMFKVPTLRNITRSAPYMHDGRFYTLEAVLNHYASGVNNTENLDPSLNNNGTLGIPLTEVEKVKIIAFLKTLTDNEFLTNSKFAEY